MRIFQYYLPVALFGLGFGLTTAYSLDGAKSPADIAPAVGGAAPRGAARHRIGALASHAAGHRWYCEWSLSNSCLRASFPALLAAAIV
jgi:hypothetical protein